MEEHFSENYIETPLFPKSTFKLKIMGFDVTKLSSSKMLCRTKNLKFIS
jgi:hypothetical protein